MGRKRRDPVGDLGRRIEALTESRGWTLAQLGRRIGMTTSNVSQARLGKRGLTKASALLLREMECSPAYDPIRPESYMIVPRRRWSLAKRRAHARRMRVQAFEDPGTREHLQRMSDRHHELPHTGPYETNQEAKLWRLVAPDGTRYEVRNLRLWTEQHVHLFPEGTTPHQAYSGLRQVNAWLRGRTKRKVSSYKGWTLDSPAEEIP